MRKLSYSILIIFISFASLDLKSQDMHFTQFYASSLYLNPAFTGAGVCSRVSLSHRNQWTDINKAYVSSLFSIDHYIRSKNIGVGLLVGHDNSGSGSLKTTIISPSIAYEAKINRKFGMRFAMQPSLGKSSINFKNLTFGDQIVRGQNVQTIEQFDNDHYYLDIAGGLLAYSKDNWIGLSLHHLNTPNVSYTSSNSASIPLKYSLHGGHKFTLNKKDLLKNNRSMSLAFNYRAQGDFDQLDLGGYYKLGAFSLGLWYRGLPIIKSYGPGHPNNESIAIIAGYDANLFKVGYSYDFTISKLHNSETMGAHEISLSYQFCNPNRKRKRRIFLECPSF